MPETLDQAASRIAAWLRIFVADDQAVNLRAIHQGGSGASNIVLFGPDACAAQAAQWDASGQYLGVYFTPNPVRPDLAGNHVGAKKADIVCRRWLLIDIDPVREPGSNATQAERQAAWNVLDRCVGELEQGCGFTSGVVGDSGNGWHLCYPINLPHDDESQALIKSFLSGLHVHCSLKEQANVDTKVFDAPRIWKLYGTWARKGPASAERPHRMAKVVEGVPWSLPSANANNARLKLVAERWAIRDAKASGRPIPAADILSRAKAYIVKEPPAISGQGGHGRCYHVACVLVKDFGLSEADAFTAIQDWNATCVPPWSDNELKHKIQSAAAAAGPVGRLADAARAQPGNNGRVEGQAVMLHDGGRDQDVAVEVAQHPFGASLGAIDADEAEVLGADALHPRVDDAAGLLQDLPLASGPASLTALGGGHGNRPPKEGIVIPQFSKRAVRMSYSF